MTNHKLSAIDFYVIQDTLLHSLYILNYGNTTKEARENVLKKIEDIMYSIEVEIITEKPNFTLDANTGLWVISSLKFKYILDFFQKPW